MIVHLSNERLRQLTIIDTPGLNTVTDANQRATAEALGLDDDSREADDSRLAMSDADALLFLTPHVRESDVEVLERFRGLFTSSGLSSANAVGILSKVDRLAPDGDPWPVAHRLAGAARERLSAVVSEVVPVMGLMAETATTDAFTEADAHALAALAGLDELDLEDALLSPQDLLDADVPGVSRDDLRRLLAMLDLHGIAVGVELVQRGRARRDRAAARPPRAGAATSRWPSWSSRASPAGPAPSRPAAASPTCAGSWPGPMAGAAAHVAEMARPAGAHRARPRPARPADPRRPPHRGGGLGRPADRAARRPPTARPGGDPDRAARAGAGRVDRRRSPPRRRPRSRRGPGSATTPDGPRPSGGSPRTCASGTSWCGTRPAGPPPGPPPAPAAPTAAGADRPAPPGWGPPGAAAAPPPAPPRPRRRPRTGAGRDPAGPGHRADRRRAAAPRPQALRRTPRPRRPDRRRPRRRRDPGPPAPRRPTTTPARPPGGGPDDRRAPRRAADRRARARPGGRADPRPPGLPAVVAEVLRLANRVHRLTVDTGHDDLRARIEVEAATWKDTEVRVVVAGEIKRGKTSFINSLLGHPGLLPSTPTWPPASTSPSGTPTPCASTSSAARPAPTPRSASRSRPTSWSTTRRCRGRPSPARAWWASRSACPTRCSSAVSSSSTPPGVGGLTRGHRDSALAALRYADALLFTVSVEEPVALSELQFLAEASERIDTVVLVLTKVDSSADVAAHGGRGPGQARRVPPRPAHRAPPQPDADEDAAEAARRFERVVAAPFFPVSARLADKARARAEAGRADAAATLLERSGLADLDAVFDRTLQNRELVRMANILRLLGNVLARIESEQTAAVRVAAGDIEAVEADLKAHQARLEELQPAQARWRQRLAGSVQRIQADLNRVIGREMTRIDRVYRDHIDAAGKDVDPIMANLGNDLEQSINAAWASVAHTLADAPRRGGHQDRDRVQPRRDRAGDAAGRPARVPPRRGRRRPRATRTRARPTWSRTACPACCRPARSAASPHRCSEGIAAPSSCPA